MLLPLGSKVALGVALMQPASPQEPDSAVPELDVPPEPAPPELAGSPAPAATTSAPPASPSPSESAEPTEAEAEPEEKPRRRRTLFVRQPLEDREPAGSHAGSFFDPGDPHPAGRDRGLLQIRGYVATNFFVTQRSNIAERDAEGNFETLAPMPSFDVNSAELYVGAPIVPDAVHALIAMEFLSLPQSQVTASQPDILSQARRVLLFESVAIEANPFVWAKQTAPWFRRGFKLSAGVFIVPFGLEDEVHASPVNMFVTRPRSMTTARVYPGTWSDVGVSLKWKPTFEKLSSPRPIEIDVGVFNSDPCTQTRFLSSLLEPAVLAPTCSRRRRPGELDGDAAELEPVPINSGFFGIAPDNNTNKAFVTRVRGFPVPALMIGGSFVYAKHPAPVLPEVGDSTAELGQAPSWRAGAHVKIDFDDMFDTRYPLPNLRGEVVYGVDRAVDQVEFADRAMLGGYAQVSQMLFRRKNGRPGVSVQYRFDHADPDLVVPGIVAGVPLRSDLASFDYRSETARQGHAVGLNFAVTPRVILKAEYLVQREDGGRANQLADDLFALEAVVDF